MKEILQKYPEAVKVQNKYGSLPLHVALQKKASNEIITMIFEANPEATKEQDNDGSLPLHVALQKKASNEIITMI
ncbi:MAG: ankyrin repeat domain-containing protein, partial [bacterium]